MLNSNLKKAINWGFIELQVLMLVKTCVIIHFCFVFDVLQACVCVCVCFFFCLFVFFSTKTIFCEEVTSKYTIFHIFGTFSDTLREQVSGGSTWNIRALTVDGMKICQFLEIPLFLLQQFSRQKFLYLL